MSMKDTRRVHGEILTTGGESTMYRVKGYIVHCIDHRLILCRRIHVTSMALERKVVTVGEYENRKRKEREEYEGYSPAVFFFNIPEGQ